VPITVSFVAGPSAAVTLATPSSRRAALWSRYPPVSKWLPAIA
jgi:hypothetical protein